MSVQIARGNGESVLLLPVEACVSERLAGSSRTGVSPGGAATGVVVGGGGKGDGMAAGGGERVGVARGEGGGCRFGGGAVHAVLRSSSNAINTSDNRWRCWST